MYWKDEMDRREQERKLKNRIESGFFSYGRITQCDDYFFFTGAMCSVPGLQHCEDNHEVTEVLKKARVIRTTTDPEMCATWVYFKSLKAAHNFIDRLNEYIRKNHNKCKECGK